MEDKRLREIRLPLQIGTSALWSLARTSMFCPGVVLIAVGLWVTWQLRDGGEGMAIGLGVVVAGGALIAFAYFHYKHLMAERPSDVVLDTSGLRIEGGRRDGLALTWDDIDADRCRLVANDEKRVTGLRLVLNLPLIAVSVAGGDDATMGLMQEVAVHRLYVVRKSDSEKVLVAETDVEVERHSLETLIRTIQSSRWRPGDATRALKRAEANKEKEKAPSTPTKKKKNAHVKDGPKSITCPNCGAMVAPSALESVTCRFCNGDVRVPSDVRKRVEAAASLASTRRSGMIRLERLLASQPSARLANITMWLAAVPIAIAWPLAGWLVVHNLELGMLTPWRVFALLFLPLLMTFGAFVIARGRLTDRFALHAVVIGFGARDPARPGEPYRCRSCLAALSEVTTTPVVYCVYCNKPNVLGLDLSGDAKEASKETTQLDEAFATREKERSVWRLASGFALVTIVVSVVVVRNTMADIKRVEFAPRDFTATVIATNNLPHQRDSTMPPLDDPKEGTHVEWSGSVASVAGRGVNCHVTLRASATHERTFAYDHDGRCTFTKGELAHYSDAWTEATTPHQPSMEIDFEKMTAVLHDTYTDDDYVGDWKITLRLR